MRRKDDGSCIQYVIKPIEALSKSHHETIVLSVCIIVKLRDLNYPWCQAASIGCLHSFPMEDKPTTGFDKIAQSELWHLIVIVPARIELYEGVIDRCHPCALVWTEPEVNAHHEWPNNSTCNMIR